MTLDHVYAVLLGVALLLPFYRVVKGPTVFDRMLGVGMIGTKTVMLICLLATFFGRMSMFVDIAVSYAMLNFIGALVVAKYLDRSEADS